MEAGGGGGGGGVAKQCLKTAHATDETEKQDPCSRNGTISLQTSA